MVKENREYSVETMYYSLHSGQNDFFYQIIQAPLTTNYNSSVYYDITFHTMNIMQQPIVTLVIRILNSSYFVDH